MVSFMVVFVGIGVVLLDIFSGVDLLVVDFVFVDDIWIGLIIILIGFFLMVVVFVGVNQVFDVFDQWEFYWSLYYFGVLFEMVDCVC